MQDPDLIWRFGRWIARRRSGAAFLSWDEGELRLGIQRGHVVSVRGPDPTKVGRMLGCPPTGEEELLAEARALATAHGLPETQAIGAVKQIVQGVLAAWLMDPDRGLELEEEQQQEKKDAKGGPTISLTHALVELVLGDDRGRLAAAALPEHDVLLRRAANFLELYSPLRLSEEADLVVAKITGQRTAEEIAARSPHGTDEVNRLLAALVTTGMLEPVVLTEEPSVDTAPPHVELPDEEPLRRRIPVRWLTIAAAVVVAILVLLTVLMVRSAPSEPTQSSSAWGLAVDMGCQPEELQRVLRKAREHPSSLRPVQASSDDGSPCWRLVWGHFPSREAAASAIPKIPSSLLLDGFTAHPVELPEEQASPVPD
jgi:hypothetical protein